MSPAELQDDIRSQHIVHNESSCSETLVVLVLQEPPHQILRDLGIAGLGSVLHGVLVQLVFLAQLHRLLPPVVHLEEIGGDTAELDQLVFLQALSQSDVVEVVETVDGLPQTVVIFVLDVAVVQGLVYNLVVVGLDTLYVRQDQRQLTDLFVLRLDG